jgi:hypothetical protein
MDIDAALEKGRNYDPEVVNQYALKSMGIDPAWGSSAFGIVVTQWVDEHIQILHAEEYQKPDYNEMLNVVSKLIKKYNINKIFIDGANPSFIRSLKIQMNERPDYEWLIERAKKMKRGVWEYMDIIPVHFSTEHKDMPAHCKIKLEKELVAINPRFDKLITALRTAVDNEGTLDMEVASYDDIFDAYRLALELGLVRTEAKENSEVKKRLEGLDIDCRQIEADRTDLFDILTALRTIILQEKENSILVNVSVGSKIQAIASMMACMMFKDTVRMIRPYYAFPEKYARLPMKKQEQEQETFGLKKIIGLPDYKISIPSEKLIKCLSLISNEQNAKITKKMLKDLAVKNNLIHTATKKNNQAESTEQAEYMALNKNLIEPMLSWKFITVSKVGSNHVVSMTNEGHDD